MLALTTCEAFQNPQSFTVDFTEMHTLFNVSVFWNIKKKAGEGKQNKNKSFFRSSLLTQLVKGHQWQMEEGHSLAPGALTRNIHSAAKHPVASDRSQWRDVHRARTLGTCITRNRGWKHYPGQGTWESMIIQRLCSEALRDPNRDKATKTFLGQWSNWNTHRTGASNTTSHDLWQHSTDTSDHLWACSSIKDHEVHTTHFRTIKITQWA